MANLILLLYNLLGQNTVVAIAALTLLINLIVLPLTWSQQKSAQRMQELQPRLEKLQKKYAKDKEKLAQAQMELYREAGFNPMGGCLPLLIQLPIWFGLVNAIRFCIPSSPLDLFQFAPHIYKWLPGVVGLVPLQNEFLGMDLGQPPSPAQWWSYALPVLVFATSWFQQKLISPGTSTPSSSKDDGQPPSQTEMMNQQMQIMMPVMLMFFTLQYSVGLSIYFVISNLIRIAQYYFMRRNMEET